ncbi:MAG: aldo/keto reductase [bacterium]|nr:aldo/keto reductase [bacterium]
MGFERATLGRTGLSVTRLGVAASYGTDEAMLEEAVERGVNYLWWGALRTKAMARGIRAVARKGREDLVIVMHAVTRKPASISNGVEDALRQLGLEYLDVLLLGNHTKAPAPELVEQAMKLREQGKLRFLALSTHRRTLIPELEKDGHPIDIYHLRYNAAHRGAETEVFDHLPDEGGPGIVSFTSNRWGSLMDPGRMPPGEAPPTAADCCRFVLSHPRVHLTCCGPANMEELRQNLDCLEKGPMSDEELERMHRIGRHVYESGAPWRAQLGSIARLLARRLRGRGSTPAS